jgi:ABC-2 type transport system ATP-binding protein
MPQRAITVRDLRRRYGAVVALDGLTFDVPTGKVVGLLGPNGSGKTTTIAILSTALRPHGGEATVCGLDVVNDAAAVRGQIGFAGQYAAVDPNLTGRENLALIGRLSRLSRRVARDRAEELLVRFDLSDAADRLVRGYSGGMRRRLDVAAALAHRPPVLFLDEPTTGLDPASRFQLWDMVRELVRDGATVLLTTQYLEEADALADEVVIIDRGRAAEVGTPDELKARVGAVVIEFTFADDRAASEAQHALAGSYDPDRSDTTLRVQSAEGSADVVRVLRALEARAPDPIDVDIHEPTLDDVFLTLTGWTATTDDEQTRGAA